MFNRIIEFLLILIHQQCTCFLQCSKMCQVPDYKKMVLERLHTNYSKKSMCSTLNTQATPDESDSHHKQLQNMFMFFHRNCAVIYEPVRNNTQILNRNLQPQFISNPFSGQSNNSKKPNNSKQPNHSNCHATIRISNDYDYHNLNKVHNLQAMEKCRCRYKTEINKQFQSTRNKKVPNKLTIKDKSQILSKAKSMKLINKDTTDSQLVNYNARKKGLKYTGMTLKRSMSIKL